MGGWKTSFHSFLLTLELVHKKSELKLIKIAVKLIENAFEFMIFFSSNGPKLKKKLFKDSKYQFKTKDQNPPLNSIK